MFVRAKTTFPDLLEIPSYLERIGYVRGIYNNQAFISYKYQNSVYGIAQILAGENLHKIFPYLTFKSSN